MQNSFDKYIHYSATDFAMDDDFINWVLFPVSENDTFWEEFLKCNPRQNRNIETARNILFSFDNKAEKVPDEIKNRIWQSVISKAENGKVVRIRSRKLWMVAASVLIVLAVGFSYFYLNKNENNKMPGSMAKNTMLKNDIAPGGNKAVLTLANGFTITLDSAQNGILSQQGNSQVIKLNDGKLIYQKDRNTNAVAVQYNTITTPRGGQYQLVLADGSKVWLNAASSIRFPTAFTGKERNVQITGEAYFEVAHNASMPFHVKVNNMDVAVLGTHFNINTYDDGGVMKTTLLEGSVRVSQGIKSVLITPGEQAQIADKEDKIEIKRNVDLEEVVAWKNGKFVFSDANIKTVMDQLARWYNFNIEFTGEIKDKFHVEITRNTNVSNVFKILEGTGGVHFKIEENKVLVMP